MDTGLPTSCQIDVRSRRRRSPARRGQVNVHRFPRVRACAREGGRDACRRLPGPVTARCWRGWAGHRRAVASPAAVRGVTGMRRTRGTSWRTRTVGGGQALRPEGPGTRRSTRRRREARCSGRSRPSRARVFWLPVLLHAKTQSNAALATARKGTGSTLRAGRLRSWFDHLPGNASPWSSLLAPEAAHGSREQAPVDPCRRLVSRSGHTST